MPIMQILFYLSTSGTFPASTGSFLKNTFYQQNKKYEKKIIRYKLGVN